MKTSEFFVENFHVDLGRSQIVNQDAIVSMEPKALNVLLVLAESQGQVVTQKELLDKVWTHVEVAPNTLQRCITQLRKALNDDAKKQRVIATHPRVGYSLVADVNWQVAATDSSNDLKESKKKNNASEKARISSKFAYTVVAALLISLFVYQLIPSERSLPLGKVTQLTTTDARELNPSFSPDGRYLAFHRDLGSCERHIWVKDLSQNKEYRLTKEPGVYGHMSWSPNGQQLVFSNVTHCTPRRAFRGCSDIRALNFVLAKNTPQMPRKVLACDKKSYLAITWLSDDELVFFESEESQRRVMALSLSDNELRELYSSDSYHLYSLDYSIKLQKLAVTQFDSLRNGQLVLLSPEGKVLDVNDLKVTDKLRGSNLWDIYWDEANNRLVSGRENKIYQIDLKGNFTEHSVLGTERMWGLTASSDGSMLAASMGVFDTDIVESYWHADDIKDTYQLGTFSIIARSTVGEFLGKYQPQGDKIAFISERNGVSQIWITDEEQPIQLTHQERGAEIDSFVWSGSGKLIAYVSDGKLQLIDLNGQLQTHDFGLYVQNVYQHMHIDKLLLSAVYQNESQLIVYDINSSSMEVLYRGAVSWAQLSKDKTLYISDGNGEFFKIPEGQKQSLAAINALYPREQFILKNNRLYIVDDLRDLWSYNIDQNSTQKLTSLGDGVTGISDIDLNKNRMLVTKVNSARKEIVLFQH